MKTLDKYIVCNFLKSALLCMVAIILLRIAVSLFLEMDEFVETKHGQKTLGTMLHQIFTYYGFQSMAYFRQLGGVIIVAAAAFLLWRMNHTNELTAVMASGVSLHRILLPIIICAIGFNFLIVIDSELLIPPFKYQLVRDPEDVSGKETYQIRLIVDGKNSAWYSRRFELAHQRLEHPLIILRDERLAYLGHLTGPVAVYDKSAGWMLKGTTTSAGRSNPAVMQLAGCQHAPTTDFIPTVIGPDTIIKYVLSLPKNRNVDWREGSGILIRGVEIHDLSLDLTITADILTARNLNGRLIGTTLENAFFEYHRKGETIAYFHATTATYKARRQQRGWVLTNGKLIYESDLSPRELALRQSGNWTDYMSTAELTRLLRLRKVPDLRRAMLVRHTRFADFFNNIIMLLVAVPFILSRERNTKVSAGLALLMAGGTFAFIYLARYIGLNPALAAWLPILVFGPVAAVMFDTIKT